MESSASIPGRPPNWAAWFRLGRDYARDLRRLKAARESIDAIRSTLSTVAQDQAESNETELRLMRAEVDGAVDRAIKSLPPRSFFARPRAEVRNVTQNERAAIADLDAALETMQRLIDDGIRTVEAELPPLPRLDPSSPPEAAPEPRAQDETAPATNPWLAKSPPEFAPNEAQLLAGLTEKFFASAAFKAMGAALVAAVVLAATGDFIIGEKSVNLRNELDKAGTDAIAKLNDVVKDKRTLLDTVSSDFNAQTDKFLKTIADDKADLHGVVTEFRSGSDELKKQAVAETVRQLNESLKEPQSDLSQKIADMRGGLENLKKQDVHDLETRIGTVKFTVGAEEETIRSLDLSADKLGKLDAAVKQFLIDAALLPQQKANAETAAFAAKQASESAAQRATEAEQAKNTVLENIKALATASQKLQIDVRSASGGVEVVQSQLSDIGKSTSASKETAGKAAKDVEALTQAVAAQRESLNGVTTRIESLKAAIANIDTESTDFIEKLRAMEHRLESVDPRLTSVEHQLNEMEKRMKADQNRLDVQLAPHSESDLGTAGWVRIQSALARQEGCECNPGVPDGAPGSNTRRAIRNFQNKLRHKADGRLSPDEISALWITN